MIRQLSFLLLSILLVTSCKNKSNFDLPENLHNNYPVAFNQVINGQLKGVSLQSDLRANAQGDTLLFYAVIDNHTSDEICIPSYGFQLKTTEGHKSHPVNQNSETVIPAHTSKTLSLKFTPITNRFLYYRTGYRGDMDSCYIMTIDCLKGSAKVKFPSMTVRYDGVIADERIDLNAFRKNDKFAFFDLDKSQKPVVSETKNKVNVQCKERGAAYEGSGVSLRNIHLSETEILIDGTTFNTRFYTLEENLYLMLKIINHGRSAIYFHPDSLSLSDNDKTYIPNLNSKEKGDHQILDSGTYVLKKGQRYEGLISYGLFKSHGFTLNLSSMEHALDDNVFSEMKFAYKRLIHP